MQIRKEKAKGLLAYNYVSFRRLFFSLSILLLPGKDSFEAKVRVSPLIFECIFTKHFAANSSLQLLTNDTDMDVRPKEPSSLTCILTLRVKAELYKAIYQYILKSPHIVELTVEDPAEAFEDLRDKNDLLMLLAHEQFMEEAFGPQEVQGAGGIGRARKTGRGEVVDREAPKGQLVPPANKPWIEKWRKDLKIAGVRCNLSVAVFMLIIAFHLQRQFQRLIEMLILLHLDPSDKASMKAYRLQVKERLYRFNFVSWSYSWWHT